MSFPTIPDKHRDPSTFPPRVFLDALRESGWQPGAVPDSVLLTYAHLERFLAVQPDLYTPNDMLGTGPGTFFIVNGTNDRVAVNCLGIGAPAAVAQMELQADLGVRRFISIGTAGCFDPTMEPGDLVLVTKGLRDEGTSHHYLPADAEAVPDPDLNQAFAGALTAAGLDYRSGVTLTTDAPNRITAREIQRMREDGVLTVEMEAAAVFAAGSALGVQTACAVVADSVADENMSWHLDAAAAGQTMLALFAPTVDLLAEID